MKLCGMTLTRNDSWCLEATLRSALRWCDSVAVLDDDSDDATPSILEKLRKEFPGRVSFLTKSRTTEFWPEMDYRQELLLFARISSEASHYAIIDSDEVLTANLVDRIRGEFESLAPGECLEVPMIAMRALDVYQDDDSIWSHAWLTLGFCDRPIITWKPGDDGYQYHHREPYGSRGQRRYLTNKTQGGVMHLQFAHRRNLVAKHWAYAYSETIRWPGRQSQHDISIKYSHALMKAGHLGVAPEEWWNGHPKKLIKLDSPSWHEGEIRRMVDKYGEKAFEGIKLSDKRPV